MTNTSHIATDLSEQIVLRHALHGLQRAIDGVDEATLLIDPMPETMGHSLALAVLGEVRKKLEHAQRHIDLTLTGIIPDATTV